MRYSKYPSYRDSGVEWLGKIPEHWETPALKWFISIASGEGLSNNDIEPVYDDYNRYKVVGGNGVLGYSSKHNTISKVFSIGRVGALCGNVHFIDEDCWITDNSLKVSYWRNLVDKFLYNLLLAANLNDYANKSAQPLITGGQVKSLKIPFPPLLEQQTIANYLDTATAKIDTLIEKQTKLIELLKEKRQAVISTAVTRGLDPSVPMKDSGVEWLGEVPTHYEVKRLASIGVFSKGGGFSKKDLVESGVPAILYGDIYTRYDIQIKSISRFISNEVAKDVVKITKGDLLLTGSGETVEDIGKCVTYLEEEVICAGGDVIIFRQLSEDSLFLSYALGTEGSILQKTLSAKGQIIIHIYASSLRNIILPLPPLDEQREITRYLDDKTSRIDRLITKATKAIDLLKEKRTALISSVVTGKIDVRGIVA